MDIIGHIVIFERKAREWLYNGSVISRFLNFVLWTLLLAATALLFNLAIEVSQSEKQKLDKIDYKGDHDYSE